MKIFARLALQQLKKSRNRTIWTLFGIVLSVSMLVSLGGFALNGGTIINEVITNLYNNEAAGAGMESAIFVLAVIIGTVVATTAIIVISNAFRVSAGERIQQFGIMKSMGATKKQIRSTVVYEGIFLSIIGLPIGFVLGLVLQLIATILVNNIMGNGSIRMSFSVSPSIIFFSMAFSFFVIVLSAWLPARKAARISAISAIRGTGEVKLKKEKPKKSWLIGRVFGIEGQLAAKQLKRSRRHFRATVISISVCIVLVLASQSLNSHMFTIFDGRAVQMGDMSLNIQFFTPTPETSSINAVTVEEITSRLQAFPSVEISGSGSKIYSRVGAQVTVVGHRAQDIVTLVVLETELYERIVEYTGVSRGSNILINVALKMDSQGNFVQYNPFDNMTGQTLALYSFVISLGYDGGAPRATEVKDTPFDILIGGQISELPNDLLMLASSTLTVIVPELYFTNYQWSVSTNDPVSFMQYAYNLFDNYIILQDGEMLAIMDIMDEFEITIGVINFFSAFASIFSTMIALLGLTNVISTIITNIRLRAKEFAILTSIGMTKSGIGRMLRLESLLGSIRALTFGLPLGVLMAWLVYQGISLLFGHFFSFPFIVPWVAIIACAVGVFIITFAIMRFSAFSLNKRNTIETIRNGGM